MSIKSKTLSCIPDCHSELLSDRSQEGKPDKHHKDYWIDSIEVTLAASCMPTNTHSYLVEETLELGLVKIQEPPLLPILHEACSIPFLALHAVSAR